MRTSRLAPGSLAAPSNSPRPGEGSVPYWKLGMWSILPEGIGCCYRNTAIAAGVRFYLPKDFRAAGIRFYLPKDFRAAGIRFYLHKECDIV